MIDVFKIAVAIILVPVILFVATWAFIFIVATIGRTIELIGKAETRSFHWEKRMIGKMKTTFFYRLFKSRIDHREKFIDSCSSPQSLK